MQRRDVLAAAAAIATGPALSAAALAALESLPRTPRMPVLFLGHGSPMNAIEDNAFRRSWQALGAEFGSTWPKPQLIVCISAHWLTSGWRITGQAKPPTIHDFGGFPPELHAQQYPAPGAPKAAAEIALALRPATLKLDESEWGYDHGTWSVLKPMFPAADIPLLQLSLNGELPPADHHAMGRRLAALREHGVLIVGSGNIVHNLRASKRGASAMQAYDWASEFDARVAGWLDKGDLDALARFQELGTVARMAHPTYEHYLPLLHAAGAASGKERLRSFNTAFQSASISMRSLVWG